MGEFEDLLLILISMIFVVVGVGSYNQANFFMSLACALAYTASIFRMGVRSGRRNG